MIFTPLKLKDAYLLEVKKIGDDRGFFGRSWCKNEMEEHGLNSNVVQQNVSLSKIKGTLRGMHYQKAPHAETKLIRCTKGAIYDVIIDIRPDSPTFKQWVGEELTEDNYKMMYVPEGFAHGFITLKEDCEVTYLVTEFYTPGVEGGIRWNDPMFNIEWPAQPVVLSDKDANHPDYSI